MFTSYIGLGFEHILDDAAYDHILFLVALCAVYKLSDWKILAWLVTAFTIGHSLTLVLSAYDLVLFSSKLIEFLIPLTIFLTASLNLFFIKSAHKDHRIKYFMALIFGLIHGLGFSTYFKALLGAMGSITLPLFAFNIGVELGQLVLVGLILLLSFIAMERLKLDQNHWTIFISTMAIAGSIWLMAKSDFIGI